jgi:oxalate decarboxylase/phosphoglucose isomerase-like protein (cupin superfamily)
MNTPHTHPRAAEFLYVVSNGQLEAGFIEENGARFVINTLTQGQGTIFPKGSIHFQANLGCEPLTFVAALNDEDPGASQIAQRCKYPELLVFGDDVHSSFLSSLRTPI